MYAKQSRYQKRTTPYPRYKKQYSIQKNIQRTVFNTLSRQAESKEANTIITSANLTGGYIQVLNNITEGTDYTQRIGRHISPRNIQVDYQILNPSSQMDYGQVALVWDKSPDGGAATFNQIFDITSANPGNAFKNTSLYKDRFRILWVDRFQLQSEATSVLGNFESTRHSKFYKLPSKFYKCEYLSSGSSVPATGALYICMGSFLNGNGGLNGATLTANCRFTFTDL